MNLYEFEKVYIFLIFFKKIPKKRLTRRFLYYIIAERMWLGLYNIYYKRSYNTN